MIDLLRHYFPTLTTTQEDQFAALGDLYTDWNSKINVISRKDIDNLYERHILHSLAIDKVLHFKDGTKVLDFGTGGGLPGIPLAIVLPQVHFCLIDSIGKKIHVATEIANAIGLKNITFRHERGEEESGKYDFVVSRAVMPLGDLAKIVRKNIAQQQHNALPNGLITLKGGEVGAEVAPFKHKASVYKLSDYFDEPFFDTKKIVYLPL
ncbi:16S rRNA (guanine(527)-N(7))-methyltransferase RsmG [Microbacter margulisiae]|uniref:Ribosomal RNA small subunit methyltransferase G n=1 Tax=Microbacter margulisiae TaxID=1350067 RepID=A0A7W5H0U8_9PORP|nr:16S rRNA (guanine(527)-N(7))-methyltransferase RsmG [Microbacter margulisiae]MBB3185944.1 16S rRNA (guanine527-N7)-methyltransferase [Microbacter margulisiae]